MIDWDPDNRLSSYAEIFRSKLTACYKNRAAAAATLARVYCEAGLFCIFAAASLAACLASAAAFCAFFFAASIAWSVAAFASAAAFSLFPWPLPWPGPRHRSRIAALFRRLSERRRWRHRRHRRLFAWPDRQRRRLVAWRPERRWMRRLSRRQRLAAFFPGFSLSSRPRKAMRRERRKQA